MTFIVSSIMRMWIKSKMLVIVNKRNNKKKFEDWDEQVWSDWPSDQQLGN